MPEVQEVRGAERSARAACHWYVVHCEAHQDRQVQRLVERRGLEVFAPRMPRTRRRNGDKPLFPGYLFVRLALKTGVWERLRYLPGIRSLVEIGGGPCPVDDGIVEVLRRRVASYSTEVVQFRPGDPVRVAGGVLADLQGIFSERIRGEERVGILLDLMHRQVRVELPLVEIEPLMTSGHPAGGRTTRAPGIRHSTE